MATAAIPGFKASLYVSATSDSGGTTGMGVRFAELKDFTLTIASGALDATSKDSAGWKEHLPGLKEWSGSGSANYLQETSGVGQTSAYAALIAGSNLGVVLYQGSSLGTIAGTSQQKWTGTAVVTGWDVESPLDGAAVLKICVKGRGAITQAAATS